MVPEIVRKEATQSHIYTSLAKQSRLLFGCKIYLVQHRMNEQYLEEDFLFRLFLCLVLTTFSFPFEFVSLMVFSYSNCRLHCPEKNPGGL